MESRSKRSTLSVVTRVFKGRGATYTPLRLLCGGAMGKIPSFQFYPRDWLTDANLRRCTPLARSVWMDLLCIMWECDIRGVLSTDGEAWSDDEIATAVPGDTYKNRLALQELLRNRVAKRNDIGAVYSKRMVEDDQQRQKWRVRQSKKRGHAD